MASPKKRSFKEEIEREDRNEFAAKYAHCQNIESSEKLLLLLKMHHGKKEKEVAE